MYFNCLGFFSNFDSSPASITPKLMRTLHSTIAYCANDSETIYFARDGTVRSLEQDVHPGSGIPNLTQIS